MSNSRDPRSPFQTQPADGQWQDDRTVSPPAHRVEQPLAHARPNDLILLLSSDHKRYLLRLRPDQRFHCHLGHIAHNDLLDRPMGTTVTTQLGHSLLMLDPALGDLMTRLKRVTQIIYPKDAAHLVHRMSLRAGCRVVEAGTGSGALTTALAWAVAPTGKVYTYEVRQDIVTLARNNLELVGMLPYVEMFQRSISAGFGQTNVDALFLDVREPWLFLPQVKQALRPGGFFASLVPTTNQVSDLLQALEANNFADIAVEEILLRRYKATPERLRPDDHMVGHTGYLLFARALTQDENAGPYLSVERQRYLARIQAQEVRNTDRSQTREETREARKYPRLPLPG